jgi:hypothetical protein
MMNRVYVFMSMSICNIGGAQQYLFNKVNYLENKGFRVIVFSGMTREILIHGLKKYRDCIIPAIMYCPFFFKKNELTRTINKIKNRIGDFDKCYIESSGINVAAWAEILAKHLNCKHFIFNVQELHCYSKTQIDFLKFKYSQHELSGILSDSIPLMLNEKKEIIDDSAVWRAYCNNVVYDVEDSISNNIDWDNSISFGSIGRLAKDYQLPLVKSCVNYASLYPNKNFNLIMIGGPKDNKLVRKIYKIVNEIGNIKLYVTGYLYPIPRSLIRRINVFLSTSGSALVSYKERIPTIKLHPVSGKPAGIMGYSFDNEKDSMYNELDNTTNEELISDILENKVPIQYSSKILDEYDLIMKEEFKRQLDFITQNVIEFYNVNTILPSESGIKWFLYLLCGKLLGGNQMQKLLEYYRNITGIPS